MPARGRPVGTKTRPWRDALERAARELGEGKEKKLYLAARSVVAAAIDGDMTAAKELGDRLDGKPAQATEHTGAGGGPLVITWQRPS